MNRAPFHLRHSLAILLGITSPWLSSCSPREESSWTYQGPMDGIVIRDQKGRVLTAMNQCPTGHRNLKKVPIVYGWGHGPPAEESESYPEWVEFRDKLERGDIAAGGWSTSENEPDVMIQCGECGFQCDAWGISDGPPLVYWIRVTKDPNDSFASMFARSFPIPDHPETSSTFEYHLEMDENGVNDEQLIFSIPTSDLASFLPRLRQWTFNLQTQPPIEIPPVDDVHSQKFFFNALVDDLRIFVELRPRPDANLVEVTVMICPKDPKDSQVSVRHLNPR